MILELHSSTNTCFCTRVLLGRSARHTESHLFTGLILLCLQSQSETESHWTKPEVVIFSADQKERGLWGPKHQ